MDFLIIGSGVAGLRAAIDAGADVAVGSRLVGDADVKLERNWFRGLIGRMFASAARRCGVLPASSMARSR